MAAREGLTELSQLSQLSTLQSFVGGTLLPSIQPDAHERARPRESRIRGPAGPIIRQQHANQPRRALGTHQHGHEIPMPESAVLNTYWNQSLPACSGAHHRKSGGRDLRLAVISELRRKQRQRELRAIRPRGSRALPARADARLALDALALLALAFGTLRPRAARNPCARSPRGRRGSSPSAPKPRRATSRRGRRHA